MKHLIIILATIALLFVSVTWVRPTNQANAARPNLLANGSFEEGFNGWHVQGSISLAPGRCGATAARMDHSFLRHYFQPSGRKQYKLVFYYKGELETSVANGERLKADEWTRFARRFDAHTWGNTIWFMDWGAEVDCVKLVRLK